MKTFALILITLICGQAWALTAQEKIENQKACLRILGALIDEKFPEQKESRKLQVDYYSDIGNLMKFSGGGTLAQIIVKGEFNDKRSADTEHLVEAISAVQQKIVALTQDDPRLFYFTTKKRYSSYFLGGENESFFVVHDYPFISRQEKIGQEVFNRDPKYSFDAWVDSFIKETGYGGPIPKMVVYLRNHDSFLNSVTWGEYINILGATLSTMDQLDNWINANLKLKSFGRNVDPLFEKEVRMTSKGPYLNEDFFELYVESMILAYKVSTFHSPSVLELEQRQAMVDHFLDQIPPSFYAFYSRFYLSRDTILEFPVDTYAHMNETIRRAKFLN